MAPVAASFRLKRSADGARETPGFPDADLTGAAYLFVFRVRYGADEVEESLEKLLVTPGGWVASAPRWQDLCSPRNSRRPVEDAATRRAHVFAAFEVARREIEGRAEARLAVIKEAAGKRLAAEQARLDAFYADLVLEALAPIRKVIHQLAASQTYLELTKSAATAAHFAAETAGLRERVESFLASRRTTVEVLEDEHKRRAAVLSQRYEVRVEVELVALAEVEAPEASVVEESSLFMLKSSQAKQMKTLSETIHA